MTKKKKEKVLVRNRAQCLNCKDILESKHHHDWVSCHCYTQSVLNLENFDSSPYRKDGKYKKKYQELLDQQHGFFLDGGTDYIRRGGFGVSKGEIKDLSEYK